MAGFLAGIMTSPRHGKSPLRLYSLAAQILSRGDREPDKNGISNSTVEFR